VLCISAERCHVSAHENRLRALGQSADGMIDVAEDHLRLEVSLPWLLAKLSERLGPAIRKEGALVLAKK